VSENTTKLADIISNAAQQVICYEHFTNIIGQIKSLVNRTNLLIVLDKLQILL